MINWLCRGWLAPAVNDCRVVFPASNVFICKYHVYLTIYIPDSSILHVRRK